MYGSSRMTICWRPWRFSSISTLARIRIEPRPVS
jgi:hypothetical protein